MDKDGWFSISNLNEGTATTICQLCTYSFYREDEMYCSVLPEETKVFDKRPDCKTFFPLRVYSGINPFLHVYRTKEMREGMLRIKLDTETKKRKKYEKLAKSRWREINVLKAQIKKRDKEQS
jgi:hypothetical protein